MHAISATPSPMSPTMLASINNAPRYGTVIPNRIFVGGIDFKTSEDDLQTYFSEFGTVRDTKIIRDRADVSKGYGFVTFNTADEASKAQDQRECLYLNGKKLNIAPAVRKQQSSYPKDIHLAGPVGSWVLHPGGYASFTTSNGSTYFQPVALGTQISVPNQNSPYVVSYNGATVPTLQQQLVAPTHYAAYPTGSVTPQMHQNYSVQYQWNGQIPPGACGQLISPAPQGEGVQQNGMAPTPVQSCSPTLAVSSVQRGEHPCPQQQANQTTKMGQVVASPVQLQMPPSYTTLPNQGVPVHHSIIHHAVPENQQVQMCSPGRQPPHISNFPATNCAGDFIAVSGQSLPYCFQPAYSAVPAYANVYENSGSQICEVQSPPLNPKPQA